MAKNSIRDFDNTSGNNTDIQSVDISEGCSPAGINNAIREMMADLADVNDGTVALESPQADSLTVTGDLTVDTNTLHVDSTNNRVGIGTSIISSGFKMEVTGDVRFGDAYNDDAVELGWSAGGSVGFVQAFDRAASAFRDLQLNNTVTVTSGGSVGIGETNPPTKLSLGSTVGASAVDITNHIGLFGDSYGFGITASQLNYVSGDAHVFHNYTGGEKMRIDSNGRLAVGTAVPTGDSGSTFYRNVSGNFVANFINDHISGYGLSIGTDSSSAAFFYSNSARTVIAGSISVSGTTASYNTSSDYRLKENVEAMTGAITRVKTLKPKRFSWIADDLDDANVDGFLAHEVSDIVPEAITGEKDAMRDEEYEVTPAVLDDDGNVVTEAVMGTRSVPDYQGIDQAKLVPLLTAALQEAIAKIETLETENATQATQIADLITRVTALEAN